MQFDLVWFMNCFNTVRPEYTTHKKKLRLHGSLQVDQDSWIQEDSALGQRGCSDPQQADELLSVQLHSLAPHMRNLQCPRAVCTHLDRLCILKHLLDSPQACIGRERNKGLYTADQQIEENGQGPNHMAYRMGWHLLNAYVNMLFVEMRFLRCFLCKQGVSLLRGKVFYRAELKTLDCLY